MFDPIFAKNFLKDLPAIAMQGIAKIGQGFQGLASWVGGLFGGGGGRRRRRAGAPAAFLGVGAEASSVAEAAAGASSVVAFLGAAVR